jgi:hypothetical protein
MLDIRVEPDKKQYSDINELLKHLPGEAEKATVMALNKTIKGVRSEVVKAVTATYLIKAADVRETIDVKGATKNDMQATLKSRGSVLGIQHFRHSPKKALPRPKVGIKVQDRRDSKGGKLPGTFVIDGLEGIFRRENAARLYKRGKRAGSAGIHLERVPGPAVPSMISTVIDEQNLQEKAGDRMAKELDAAVNMILVKGISR